MNYELFVGLRYLRARRRETFISLLSMISILGVMIAVLTLNVVIGVMTGFEEVLRDRLLGINSHVVLVKSGDRLVAVQRTHRASDKGRGGLVCNPHGLRAGYFDNGESDFWSGGSGGGSGYGKSSCCHREVYGDREPEGSKAASCSSG